MRFLIIGEPTIGRSQESRSAGSKIATKGPTFRSSSLRHGRAAAVLSLLCKTCLRRRAGRKPTTALFLIGERQPPLLAGQPQLLQRRFPRPPRIFEHVVLDVEQPAAAGPLRAALVVECRTNASLAQIEGGRRRRVRGLARVLDPGLGRFAVVHASIFLHF